MKVTRRVNGEPVTARELSRLAAKNPTLERLLAEAAQRAERGKRRR